MATEKGRMLFEGPADPLRNPVRYRKCEGCRQIIDLLDADPGVEWTSPGDTFRHRDCVDVLDR